MYSVCLTVVAYTLTEDIAHDISTAYCRSSSGNGVNLLFGTICTTVVVSNIGISGTSLVMVGGFHTTLIGNKLKPLS